MSADRIRGDHVVFLLEKCGLGAEELQTLSDAAMNGTGNEKLQVLKRLEKLVPGATRRLSRIWTAYGRQSMYLWGAQCLVPLADADAVRALLVAAVQRTDPGFSSAKLGPEWTAVPPPDGIDVPKQRVLRVRAQGDEVAATVRVSKVFRFVFEDEERESELTYDVTLLLDAGKGRTVKVFGPLNDGRRSLRTFLEWLLNQELPERAPRVYDYMTPITFKEHHVKSLAAKRGMELVGMEGPDHQGKIGKVGYEGRAKDFHAVPLDFADPRVKAQDAVVQETRTYNFVFDHSEDSFKERSRVTFVVTGLHPHFLFPVKTSQPAILDVAEALRAEVGLMP